MRLPAYFWLVCLALGSSPAWAAGPGLRKLACASLHGPEHDRREQIETFCHRFRSEVESISDLIYVDDGAIRNLGQARSADVDFLVVVGQWSGTSSGPVEARMIETRDGTPLGQGLVNNSDEDSALVSSLLASVVKGSRAKSAVVAPVTGGGAASTPPPSSNSSDVNTEVQMETTYKNPLARGFFWSGLGVAAVGGGLGVASILVRDSVQDGTTRPADEVQTELDRADRLGVAADVLLIAGGVSMGLGAIFWLTKKGRVETGRKERISFFLSSDGAAPIAGVWGRLP